MKLTNRAWLEGAIYSADCCFGDIGDFQQYIFPKESKVDFHNFTMILKEKVKNFESMEKKYFDQSSALRYLVLEDLYKIVDKGYHGISPDPEKDLERDYRFYKESLAELGIECEDVPLKIVEQFPGPFKKMKWDAFNADKVDEEKLGVPYAIYFLDSNIIPFYSSSLLAHELVHVAIGNHMPRLIARGLEDGICDLIGSVLLFSKKYGSDVTKNVFVYSRLGYNSDSITKLYLDNFNMASVLLNRYGIKGIVDIINSGSVAIKNVERAILSRSFEVIPRIPLEGKDDYLINLTEYLVSFPKNLVVSPLAKYLSRNIMKEKLISKLISEANAEINGGNEALRELQEEVYLILIDNSKIESFDEILSLNNDVLRYAFPNK